MWHLRPRLRTDGLYASRNTYIRAGVAEWKITNPVHIVCYFWYLRFFPSGRFLYKNSSQKIKDVVKCMNFRSSKADSVFGGHYTLTDDKVKAAVLYPGMRPTVLRMRLRYSPLHNARRPWEEHPDKSVQYPPTMLYTADHYDRGVPLLSLKLLLNVTLIQFIYLHPGCTDIKS